MFALLSFRPGRSFRCAVASQSAGEREITFVPISKFEITFRKRYNSPTAVRTAQKKRAKYFSRNNVYFRTSRLNNSDRSRRVHVRRQTRRSFRNNHFDRALLEANRETGAGARRIIWWTIGIKNAFEIIIWFLVASIASRCSSASNVCTLFLDRVQTKDVRRSIWFCYNRFLRLFRFRTDFFSAGCRTWIGANRSRNLSDSIFLSVALFDFLHFSVVRRSFASLCFPFFQIEHRRAFAFNLGTKETILSISAFLACGVCLWRGAGGERRRFARIKGVSIWEILGPRCSAFKPEFAGRFRALSVAKPALVPSYSDELVIGEKGSQNGATVPSLRIEWKSCIASACLCHGEWLCVTHRTVWWHYRLTMRLICVTCLQN